MGESDRAGQFTASRESPVAGLTAAPMTQKANPVTLTSYGQVPLWLEGSGASRRPGSIVRVLRIERWVRPTERAGSEGRFICRLRRQKNHTTALRARKCTPPLVAGATTFPPASGGTITRAYGSATYEESVSRCFILPPEQGEVRRSRKGGGERSEPIRRMPIMPYDTEK